MTQLEYHKGSFCYLTSAFCGEGYRVDCKTCLNDNLFVWKEVPLYTVRDVRKAPAVAAAGMPSLI